MEKMAAELRILRTTYFWREKKLDFNDVVFDGKLHQIDCAFEV